MEAFWTVKDALYLVGFGITLLGFWWRMSARIADNAAWKAKVESRVEHLEERDEGHIRRMDKNFERLFSEIADMKQEIHSISNRLTKVETKLEAK